MIIVEGPDGAGKSTLIDQLGYERVSLKALYGGKGEGAQGNWAGSDEAPVAYAKQILSAPSNIAFDRFHMSEQVYGPMLRGASGISDQEVHLLRRLLLARGVTTILCLPPLERTVVNVSQEGRERPDYQTPAFLMEAYHRWSEEYDKTFADVVRYSYVSDPYPVNLVRRRATCPPSVIGNPYAEFLIVGDQPDGPLDLPFFSMDGASGYLNRSLWDAGFQEIDLAFVNACNKALQPCDLHAALLPTTRVVIAVGSMAHQAVIDQRLVETHLVYSVPHPQYWRRANPNNRGAYVGMLREIREMA